MKTIYLKSDIKKILFLFCLFVMSNKVFSVYSVSPFPAQSLCAATFPTPYVPGSFSISEGAVDDFGSGQTGTTLIFSLPAGFEFNTIGGSFSVSGVSATDVTAISIAAAASSLTITITTATVTMVDLNTITVNCEIRATGVTLASYIKRTGGNFRINKSINKPTKTQSLGNVVASQQMAFSSCTVAQTNTTNVLQGTNDNDIVQIQVVTVGTCNAFSLTQFSLSTDGGNSSGSTNPLTNISTAKIYYTGTTNSFSAINLFATVSPVNGVFTISGSQVLATGTNYFWLVYDVPATAIATNSLDASCSSVTMDGGIGAKVPTLQNPVGSRIIKALVPYYSIATGNWNDNNNWSNTDGGPICSCQPNGSGNVFIRANQIITLNAPRTVDLVTIRDGAILKDDGTSTLNVTSNLYTLLAGKFTATSAWTVNNIMDLSGTGASTTTKGFTVVGNSNIRTGTSLTENGAAGNDVTLQGTSINLDGTLSSGTAGGTILMNKATGQNISGIGTVVGTGSLVMSASDKTITAGANFTISPVVSIIGAITVSNNGTVTLNGNLIGGVAGSAWTNAANSTLNSAGAVLATGSLNSSAAPNTVNYNGALAQIIKSPAVDYFNLTISNAGTKTMVAGSSFNVTNLVTIQNNAVFDISTNTLNGVGGLNMSGNTELKIAKLNATVPELTGGYALTGGTVTLQQSGNNTSQTVAGAFYCNLKLDGASTTPSYDLTNLTVVTTNFDVINKSQMTLNGILDVGGNFTYSSSNTASALNNNMTVAGRSSFSTGNFNMSSFYFTTGDLTLTSGTLFGGSNSIELKTGNWTNNGGIFSPGTGTVLFTGTAGQFLSKSGGETFNNITFSNTGNKTLLSPITANTVTINAGTLTANNFSISLTGNWTNNGGSFVPGTATTFFTGTTTQTLFKSGGETFYDITFSNTGNKILLSSISCNTLTINAGTLTAGSNSITLTGNWNNNVGTFVSGTGTTLFTGAGGQTVLKTGGEVFNNVTFTNTGAKTLLSNITCNNFLINTGSNLDVTINNYSVTVNGTWSNAGTFTPRAGTVLFMGATAQTILKTGGEVFNNVTFSNAGVKTLLSAITCNDFLINTGSNLDVTASNFQVVIKGNYTSNGALTTRAGTILFNGTTAQTIGGTSVTNFYDLTLNNIAGAGLSSAQNLLNTLTITTGTLSTNTQSFTMISTASNTARVAAMTATGGVAGNVIVQRYAPGPTTGWALLGTPISSALTLQDWNDNFPISCASCPNGSAGGFISIYTYDETAPGVMDYYTSYIPMTAITDPITPNKGYWVYLGTSSATTTPIMIDVTGALRQQSQTIPLSYSAVNTPTNDGWNLIHNPYPSPISWSSIYSTGTNSVNLDNAIYAYNADLTAGSAAYVNGISSPPVGSGGIGDAIPMCEGFFVHATAAKTLTITEVNKTGGNPTFLKMTGTTAIASSSTPLIRLYLDGNSNFHDETVIYSQPGATNNFDYQYDALKLNGQDITTPTIRLNDSINEFQINGIDINASNFSMPLKTITGYSGTYTISMANFNSFPTGACFTLFDKYTNTTTDLTNSNYVFTLLDTTKTSRFLLNITLNPLNITSTVAQPSCVTPTIGGITAKGLNAGPWDYYWKDASGTIIKTSLNKATTDTISNLVSGNYSLEIHTVGLCDNHTSQFTINVADLPIAQFAGTDTTYISNSGLVTFTNSSTNSVINTWDFGDMIGTSTASNPSYNYISAGVYTVSLISQSSSGCLDTATQKVVVINNATDLQVSKNTMGLLLKTISNNEFVISGNYTEGDKVQITVSDILGKNILDLGYTNSQNMQIPIDLSFAKPGVYYLTISGNKHHVVFKLPVK